MDRTRFVIDHMSHFDGNIMEFARFLKSRWVGDQNFTVRSWSNYLYRLQDQGKISLAYEKKDYDAMLPQTWDGSQSELARLMWRRDDSITLKAWANRVQQAYQRGSINRTQHPEFTVNQLKKASGSGEDLWLAIEAQSKKAIEAIEHERWVDIHMHVPEDRYIALAFASDQHIGNPFCDHERLRQDTELIEATDNCYVIHAGDYIDNFITDKPRPAMKAPIPPSVQWKLCEHYLDMTPESLMAIVAGNHDLWTSGAVDYDPLGKMAAERGVLYHKHELNIRLWVGEIPYHITVRHKRRGNSNLDAGRVIKKMWEDGEADFDIGVMGHHHTPHVSCFTRHGVERWAIRPGAYKIVDSFGEGCGFPRERPTCPIVILSPYERDIQAFSDLRHGLRTLRSLNRCEEDEDLGVE
jgi:predicted phosphodiesterase